MTPSPQIRRSECRDTPGWVTTSICSTREASLDCRYHAEGGRPLRGVGHRHRRRGGGIMANSDLDYRFERLSGQQGQTLVAMDIRLQRLLALRQHGRIKPATATTAAGEVAVIAKVS